MSELRVAIVTVVPAPYRAPLYDEVDRLLSERGGALTVVYSARTRPGVQWPDGTAPTGAVESVFLNDRAHTIRGRTVHANPLVVRSLRAARPDVVVLGGFAPWIYSAVAWCRLARVPYLIWTGETPSSARRNGDRRRMRAPLVRSAGGFLAYGPSAAEYLRELGVDERAVTVVGNAIDIDDFARRVDASRTRRSEIRSRLGLDGRVVLSVGGKGLALAETAVAQLGGQTVLAVAGRSHVQGAQARNLGKVPSAEMPDLYAAADCLVHLPELDQWPHAVNEALAAGLPVVAAHDTGAPDEVFAGPGCALVQRTLADVRAALERALAIDASESAEARDAIRAALRPWDAGRMAERIVAAAERVNRR